MQIAVTTVSISRKAGGMFTSVRQLSQSLARCEDCRVRVFAVEDEFALQDRSAWDPLQPAVFAGRGLSGFPLSVRMKTAVLDVMPDIIHTHGLWTYPSCIDLAANRRGIPYVISPRGMLAPWAVHNAQWKKWLAGWLFENRHLRRASCLHALCDAEADAIRRLGLSNPIAVIPNGIDRPEAPDLISGAGQPPGPKRTLLFLGRLHPKKGIANLLAAWQYESARMADWELVIAGWDQGGHEDELKRQAAAMGIGATVRFAGPLFGEAKDQVLRQASAFVLPSYSEGLPMAVLEAWAYGLPVLMTRECNLPEGFSAQAAIEIATDPESIQAGLQRLADMNDDGIERMGRNGRTLVAERFAWSRIAGQMVQVYRWVLDGGAVPDCVR